MPKSQTRLLLSLVPGANHVEIPRRAEGAARGLWGHKDGHMVSLCHGTDGRVSVRLTGRGVNLREQVSA